MVRASLLLDRAQQHVNALSTDPGTLLVQMRRADGGPRSAGEDFVHVGDFLRETDARPALRAALYRATALIPGVRLLGTSATISAEVASAPRTATMS